MPIQNQKVSPFPRKSASGGNGSQRCFIAKLQRRPPPRKSALVLFEQ